MVSGSRAVLVTLIMAMGCLGDQDPPIGGPDQDDPLDVPILGDPDAAAPRPDAPIPVDGAVVPDAMPLPDATFADPRSCSTLFDQEVLPDYHVEISQEEWNELMDEFLNWEAREAAGLERHPWHPIGFRYQNGMAVPNVLIRLKGSTSWHYAVAFDDPPKMQFVIAFNEIDSKGRFLGVRKVELDMPRNDPTFLRQRVALYYLRSIGIEAQCANNARLFINGQYYGLYTAMERPDKEFLQRNFGDDAGGDLWKDGWEIETNEETATRTRLNQWRDATSIAQLDAVTDLEHAVREWAAEAMILDADGYQASLANFLLYDHPTRGFMWLPHDLDAAISYIGWDASPIYPFRNRNARPQYRMLQNDPVWSERYVAALEEALLGHREADLVALVDRWAAQIADAAATDPMKPFSTDRHLRYVAEMRSALPARAEYIEDWLECRKHGGPDLDGDGHAFCRDCDDHDGSAHPGAVEQCNGLDDDCDGWVDESACSP